MPANDVTFNIRERGGRQTAAQTDRVGKGFTRLGRRARGSGRDVRFFSRATVSATGNMHLFAGAVITGSAALGAGLYVGLRKVNSEWEESRKVGAATTAVLHSTKGAANVTNREVTALATSLSRKSGIDDEAIQSGENLALTFRNVKNAAGAGNDIFTQTITLATDMSAAFTAAGKNMSVASASMLLGKALNDPAKGLTKLTRAGVSFTEQQQEQIKAMAESGDRLGAQRRILAEVRKEFGGAAAKTATPLGKMRVSIENVEESIGKGLSPVVDLAAKNITKLADQAEPAMVRLGDRLNKTFSRKDIDITEKLRLGSKDIHRTFLPFEKQIGREIKQLHLGEKISDGVEYAIPKIADAAAKAAPHAAQAFLNGWLHAGVWGKLLTLGLLERKLGVFSAFGGLASGRFGRSFVAAQTANPGRWTSLGTRLGGFLGPAMAAAAVVFLAPEILKAIEGEAGLPPGTERKRVRSASAHDLYTRAASKEFLKRNPWARGPENVYFDVQRQLGQMRTGVIPSSPAAQSYLERRSRQLRGYLRSIGDPVVTSPARTPAQARAMNVHVYIDGKEVVKRISVTQGRNLNKAVKRAEADKEARR